MSTTRKLLLGTILGGVLVLPSAAMARVAILPPRPIPPIYEPPECPNPPYGYRYRWVPPVYRTHYDRVWVEETTKHVLEWVEVAPGRWEQRWTTVTVPAHYETVTRQVLVREGYWQLVRVDPPYYYDPPPIPLPRPIPMPATGTVGVDGYKRDGGEDLSKFTPLSEWPKEKK